MNPGCRVLAERSSEQLVMACLADLDFVVSDLAEAFASYPLIRWILRDDGNDRTALLKLFEVVVRQIAYRSGDIYMPAAGGAAAVWVRSENLDCVSSLDKVRMIPTLAAATGLRRLPRLAATEWALERHHPKRLPHVYLYILGVHPRLQGSGIGSRLLRAGLDQIDAEGRAAFLETSTEHNVLYYRHFGFETMERYEIGPGAPPVWSMWRPCRGAREPGNGSSRESYGCCQKTN